jgi:hypothetical protein
VTLSVLVPAAVSLLTPLPSRPLYWAGPEVNTLMSRISAHLRALPHSPTLRRAATVATTVALVLSAPGAAHAAPVDPKDGGPYPLPVVISNLQTWVMGILAALATLFLVLAGVYWATAGGDPAQVERAKGALKNALVGYGLAVLAPVLLQVVRAIVGG